MAIPNTSPRRQPNLKPAGTVYTNARDPLDRYETPDYVTEALLGRVSFNGPVLEPAAGTGRIARVLRRAGCSVETADIQRGRDFLRRTRPVRNVVTNPPYRDNLPFLFVQKAFELTQDGTVAMLLKHGFLWSDDRHDWLTRNKPTQLIVMSDRVRFLEHGGEPIKGQFFDHLWVVWERRRMTRNRAGLSTHRQTVHFASRGE